MSALYKDFKIPIFDSKIKFYFSLIFTSKENYDALIRTFGDDIDVFSIQDSLKNQDEINALQKAFKVIKRNNDLIDLKDNVILRLFTNDEIINYFNSYSIKNPYFMKEDPEFLESFNVYMIKEKVKEKKELTFGSLYNLFDTFSDDEIINAVANLDYESKKTFIKYFGIKGDKTFLINSDDYVKNEILIRLYSYMLLKREDSDVSLIIKNEIKKESLAYTFYDYIRLMCNDNSINNSFIMEMLSKMDYNSQRYIKEVFGQKLDKKVKPKKAKNFKKAVDNLTLIIKINKEYRSKKQKAFDNKEDIKKPLKTKKIKSEQELKKEEKKPKNKPDESKKKVAKKSEEEKETKEKTKKNNKKEQKKNLKKERKMVNKGKLDDFLNDNDIKKEDFKEAIKLLDPLSKKIVILYYGINTKEKQLDEISKLLGKKQEDVLDILNDSQKEIVNVIKSTKISKKPAEKQNEMDDLRPLLKKGIEEEQIILTDNEKMVVDLYLKPKTIAEIATILNDTKQNVKAILNLSVSKIESSLSQKKSSGKKEKQEDEKITSKIQTIYSLDEFLKETDLKKDEFINKFNALDSFSKNVLAMYLGIYGKPLSKDEIAKKYNQSVYAIDNLIYKAKEQITKVSKIQKINLNDFLKQNNMTMDLFTKSLNKLQPIRKELIKSYFGIGTGKVDLDVLSNKYMRSEDEINKILQDSLNYIASNVKKTMDEKNIGKLNKFLAVNNITKEAFDNALNLLSAGEKDLVSKYFGLTEKEMSITEIALITRTKPLDVKANLTSILKKVNVLCKSKNNMDDSVMENMYKIMKRKINSIYPVLLQDANFMLYINTNPIIANILSVISNFDLDLDKTSKILMMSKQELVKNLNEITKMFDNYSLNTNKNLSKNEFYDEENKQDEYGRKSA